MFNTIKGGIATMKFLKTAREWFDGKKTYVAAASAAFAPAVEVVKDFKNGMSVFQIMSTGEWLALMGALSAVFIRNAVAKTDAKVEQVAGQTSDK